ncbi:MAG TPA: hypothetical protein VGF60_04690 [Xanthobacteraceae bacterium]|jgi:hypothetical protein
MLIVKYFFTVGLALTAGLIALNAYLGASPGSAAAGGWHSATTTSLPIIAAAPAPVAPLPAAAPAPPKPAKPVKASAARHRDRR